MTFPNLERQFFWCIIRPVRFTVLALHPFLGSFFVVLADFRRLCVNIENRAKTAKNDPKNGHRAKTVNWTGVYDALKELSFQIRKSQEKSGGVT